MEYNRYADIKRLKFIMNILKQNVSPKASVLDVGCGNGVISRCIAAEGYNVLGIDISEKAIEKARSLTALPNAEFRVISAEQLVADGQQYDAVVCSEVLEHLNYPEKLLNTLYLSLKDNGVLIVTVPNGRGPRETLVTKPVIALKRKNNWAWRFILKVKKMFGYSGATVQSDADDLTHIQFFTKKSLERLASKNHFRIVSFKKTNFIDDVFPFSIFTRRVKIFQKWDAAIADKLPYSMTGGFVTAWKKSRS